MTKQNQETTKITLAAAWHTPIYAELDTPDSSQNFKKTHLLYEATYRLNANWLHARNAFTVTNNEYRNQMHKKNYADSPARTAILFAERWAELIERNMRQGQSLEIAAKETRLEADPSSKASGIAEYAVAYLARTWPYGEDLATWYEKNVNLQKHFHRTTDTHMLDKIMQESFTIRQSESNQAFRRSNDNQTSPNNIP